MASNREREIHRIFDEPALQAERSIRAESLISVCAGESFIIRVGAIDRQSGVAEIVVRCRSVENHDLRSIGRWTADRPASNGAAANGAAAHGDHYYPVAILIPAHSPSVVWELHQIALRDAQGNCRTHHAGRDFEAMRFQVEGREGTDCAPPRLLGVKFGPA